MCSVSAWAWVSECQEPKKTWGKTTHNPDRKQKKRKRETRPENPDRKQKKRETIILCQQPNKKNENVCTSSLLFWVSHSPPSPPRTLPEKKRSVERQPDIHLLIVIFGWFVCLCSCCAYEKYIYTTYVCSIVCMQYALPRKLELYEVLWYVRVKYYCLSCSKDLLLVVCYRLVPRRAHTAVGAAGGGGSIVFRNNEKLKVVFFLHF